jgi:cellulose synthase/poly-beta-1,6-N-acetylglucosamine synthase-like glycosyltransferase
MNLPPKISVLMPAYNAGAFIRPAVDSILAQTFHDFELIILNDGSKDNTQTIVEGYDDQRIRLINKSNSGVASTLNLGLKEAKGDFIWRHDADDISLPDKLAKQVEFMDAHPDFVLCATQVAFMTERGKIAWDKRQPKMKWLGDADFREVHFEDFSPFSPVTHATVLFRTSLLPLISGYREAFVTSEDVDLWLRMMHHGRLAVLNHCDYCVRLSSASATSIHGWKNEFYRELAKKFYLQRKEGDKDELELTGRIVEPSTPVTSSSNLPAAGQLFRADLLGFQYLVALNAKDIAEVWRIVALSFRAGWRLKQTYRALVFPLLPERFVRFGVQLKARMRRIVNTSTRP